jgi:hypothetical protein
VFRKELYNGIPNAALWRVLRKRLHLKAYKLSPLQHLERWIVCTLQVSHFHNILFSKQPVHAELPSAHPRPVTKLKWLHLCAWLYQGGMRVANSSHNDYHPLVLKHLIYKSSTSICLSVYPSLSLFLSCNNVFFILCFAGHITSFLTLHTYACTNFI